MRILRPEKLPVCNCSEYSSELSISHAAASIVITSAASLFSTVCPFSGQNLRPRIPPHNHNHRSVVVFIQKKYTHRNPGGC